MDFFSGQESLTSIQWGFRAVIGFLFLLIVAKLMGRRSISQLRFLDFVIVLLLGNIIAHPLSDEGLGLKGSMISMIMVVALYLMLVLLSLKWRLLRHLFDPSPITLIENGQIIYKNLLKSRITVDILLTELRKEKTEDISKVALALWESNGTISIFLDSPFQTVTNADLNIQKQPFHLPKTIIKERKIDYLELQSTGHDEQWLINNLSKTYNVDLQDILLATIDQNEKIKVFLYK